MKYKRKKVTAIFAFAALLVMTLYGGVYADEKIGNLVFNAMRKIQETHETFLSDVKTTKAERKSVSQNLNCESSTSGPYSFFRIKAPKICVFEC